MLSTQRQGRFRAYLQQLVVGHTYHMVQLPRWRHPIVGYIFSVLLVGLSLLVGLVETQLLLPMGIPRSTPHAYSPDCCTLVGHWPGGPHDSARAARARLPVCPSLWITRGIRGERRVTTADVCSCWRHYCSPRQPARIGAAESACGRGSGNEARQPTRSDV